MAEFHNHYIEFVEEKKYELKGYTLIEGFPGLGLAGTIAAKYLVDRLYFEEIGYLNSDMFIPVIRIHKGLPVHPSRIYVNKKNKLVLFISEQIIPKKYNNLLAEQMISWIKTKKISRVISLAGIQVEEQTNDVYGMAANEKSIKVLQKYGVKIIEDGITTGITALMLLKLLGNNLEAFSIMGDVNIGADYKAAAQLIQKLNEILGLKIRIEPLLEEAKETEQALMKQIEMMKQTQEQMSKLDTSKSSSMIT